MPLGLAMPLGVNARRPFGIDATRLAAPPALTHIRLHSALTYMRFDLAGWLHHAESRMDAESLMAIALLQRHTPLRSGDRLPPQRVHRRDTTCHRHGTPRKKRFLARAHAL